MVRNEQTNDQSGEPRPSLRLTSHKVVFCKMQNKMPIQSANTNAMETHVAVNMSRGLQSVYFLHT